jgi:hypothetical protein
MATRIFTAENNGGAMTLQQAQQNFIAVNLRFAIDAICDGSRVNRKSQIANA